LREKIAEFCEKKSEKFFDEIKGDESYFGGKHSVKRGRGSENKIAVAGLLERGGKIFTKIVKKCDRKTLHKFFVQNVKKSSIFI
jgi:transposase